MKSKDTAVASEKQKHSGRDRKAKTQEASEKQKQRGEQKAKTQRRAKSKGTRPCQTRGWYVEVRRSMCSACGANFLDLASLFLLFMFLSLSLSLPSIYGASAAAAASNVVVVVLVVLKKKLLEPPQQQQQHPTLSSSSLFLVVFKKKLPQLQQQHPTLLSSSWLFSRRICWSLRSSSIQCCRRHRRRHSRLFARRNCRCQSLHSSSSIQCCCRQPLPFSSETAPTNSLVMQMKPRILMFYDL